MQKTVITPKNWNTKYVNEVVNSMHTGFACSKKFTTDAGYVHLRTHNIDINGKINLSKIVKIENEKVDLTKANLKRRDVLFNNTNSTELVGKTAFVEEDMDCAYSNHITRIVVDELQVDPKFFVYYFNKLQSENYFARLSNKWIGQSGINMTMLNRIAISFPELKEQKKIVQKLDQFFEKIDEAIILGEANIIMAENLFDSLLVDYFFLGQSKAPKDYKSLNLGDMAMINPKKSEVKELTKDLEVTFLPMKDLDSNCKFFPYSETKKLRQVYKGYTYFADGDLLLAKVTPCFENGKLGIAKNLKNGIGFGSSEYHVIRPNTKIITVDWLYHLMRSSFFRFAGKKTMTGSSGLKRVPSNYLEDFQIFVPSLEKQRAIVKSIDQIDARVKKYKEQLYLQVQNLNSLKASLLDYAFQGKLVTVKATKRINQAQTFGLLQGIATIVEAYGRTRYRFGEMVTAKYAFLLQHVMHVPLGIQFQNQSFGPYDSSIKKAVYAGIKQNYFTKDVHGALMLGNKADRLLDAKYDLVRSLREGMEQLTKPLKNANGHKVELLATVCKSILDTNSTDFAVIKSHFKNWETPEQELNTKADKFFDEEIQRCINFVLKEGWDKRILANS